VILPLVFVAICDLPLIWNKTFILYFHKNGQIYLAQFAVISNQIQYSKKYSKFWQHFGCILAIA